jgi:hypothetical protein
MKCHINVRSGRRRQFYLVLDTCSQYRDEEAGWTAYELVFDSRHGQDSFLHNVVARYEAHPAPCTIGTVSSFLRGKAAEA